jgi:hypothetical protein
MKTDNAPRIQHELNRLKGCRLISTHRAIDMRIFEFRLDAELERDRETAVSMHLQCAWRILSSGYLLTGQEDFLFPPMESFDPAWRPGTDALSLQDARCDEFVYGPGGRSKPNAQNVVIDIKADDLGGMVIAFSSHSSLEVLPTRSREELWRVVRGGSLPHFVVSGGTSEGELGIQIEGATECH